ncbi:MAG: ABC transporter substrate-binding protein, partial [Myxococcota bacterium]
PPLRDARGASVQPKTYRRIASATTIADQVLLELVEPTRIVAFSARSARDAPDAFRYRGHPVIARLEDLEQLIALRPDLVFVSNLADPRRVARLRGAGLNVFDLGPMHGVRTLIENIEQIGRLTGVSARAESLSRRFRERLGRVADHVEESERRRALYVGVHGDRLYGGTAGTSYADVLRFAGLRDVAAEAGFSGWPTFTAEQLLVLDPPWLVTQTGRETALCRHVGFSELKACQQGQVRGVEAALLSDPGLRILEAAEATHAAVYSP